MRNTMASLLDAISISAAKIRTDLPLAVLDTVLIVGAFVTALAMNAEGVHREGWSLMWAVAAVGAAAHLASNALFGLYGRVWSQAGVQEARQLLRASSTAAAVLLAASVAFSRAVGVPASAVITGSALAVLLCGGVRFHSRLFAFKRGGEDRDVTNVVIIGADNSAGAVVREMLGNPSLGLRPVAILDDDRALWGRELAGVPIIGGLDAIDAAKHTYFAQQVLFAIPAADSAHVNLAAEAAAAAGITMRVVPSVPELMGDPVVRVRDVRDLSITDLLGRKQISTDLGAVHSILAGRRVLITGAGGSIGSEIARQVAAFGPSALLLLDHDETHLHDVAGDLDFPVEQVLADIRDLDWMRGLFARLRPDVVFHAAAHKHVPLLESHPCEAVMTNVLATQNLIRTAANCGVGRFVFISTDKAVRPSSVMGATKNLGEQLLLHNRPADAPFCAVRFGNVLGSRGSVIPAFIRQIHRGGPVTVTDPDVTRYFMSIPEAVGLVLQAAALSEGGEVFMLDMGRPIRIADLANRMIRMSGSSVDIAYTGLRPGEKLNEELRSPEEAVLSTSHPSVMLVRPVETDSQQLARGVEELAAYADEHDAETTRRVLFDLVCGGATQRDDGRPSPVPAARVSPGVPTRAR